MSGSFDIKQIAEQLAPNQLHILTSICPGGIVTGKEYTAGSITGGPGKSFSFNLATGKWADFATGEKGGDIIALYAAVNRVNNAEAAKTLQEQYALSKPQHHYPVKTAVDHTIIKPPSHAVKPEMPLNRGKTPSYSWTYRDHNGEPLFYIFRYDMDDGTKTFTPLSFSTTGQWVKKQWPAPRPLYNLDKLTKNPDKHVLVVEGEKAADAASIMQNLYVVTTWPGGAQAISKTDFTPLYNRKILLWPDADTPGMKAMDLLAAQLRDHTAELKVIRTDRDGGWDAADALKSGMNQSEFIKWAKPLAEIIEKSPPPKQAVVEIMDDDGNKQIMSYRDLGLTPISDRNPSPVPNEDNVTTLLNHIPKYAGHIWFDGFYQDIVTDHTTGKVRRWLEPDDLNLLCELQGKWDMPRLSKTTVETALKRVAFANVRNELRDWLETLVWDGTERVSEFFIHAYGTDDDEYNRIIAKNWLIGLIARGMEPGCKFDEMLVLEGKQGTYKSTSLRALAGKYFAESNAQLDNKDFMQELAGTWIVEFDELDQFRKAESTLIKKKLSQQTDRYRPTYARRVIDVPRTCVFVGTTNSTEWLTDTTGNRRFWPIMVKKADLDYIKENREQIFAEAVHLYKLGTPRHEVPQSAIEEQERRREQDPWEEIIASHLGGKNMIFVNQMPVEITAARVATNILGIRTEHYDQRSARRIGKCLRVLGYIANGSERSADGSVARIFTKTQ